MSLQGFDTACRPLCSPVEELQWKYGYLPLTDEDKRKIFGGNLGKLLGIDTTKRRCGSNYEPGSQNANEQKIIIESPYKESSKVNNNTYTVTISTPMGDMDGTAVLNIDGTGVFGSLSFMGKESAFSGGTIDADQNISFKGDLCTPIGKMAYTVNGTFKDGIINAVAKTKMGNLAIKTKQEDILLMC